MSRTTVGRVFRSSPTAWDSRLRGCAGRTFDVQKTAKSSSSIGIPTACPTLLPGISARVRHFAAHTPATIHGSVFAPRILASRPRLHRKRDGGFGFVISFVGALPPVRAIRLNSAVFAYISIFCATASPPTEFTDFHSTSTSLGSRSMCLRNIVTCQICTSDSECMKAGIAEKRMP